MRSVLIAAPLAKHLIQNNSKNLVFLEKCVFTRTFYKLVATNKVLTSRDKLWDISALLRRWAGSADPYVECVRILMKRGPGRLNRF